MIIKGVLEDSAPEDCSEIDNPGRLVECLGTDGSTSYWKLRCGFQLHFVTSGLTPHLPDHLLPSLLSDFYYTQLSNMFSPSPHFGDAIINPHPQRTHCIYGYICLYAYIMCTCIHTCIWLHIYAHVYVQYMHVYSIFLLP